MTIFCESYGCTIPIEKSRKHSHLRVEKYFYKMCFKYTRERSKSASNYIKLEPESDIESNQSFLEFIEE
ncbi:hypothetical protein TNCT_639581 [Trichonephila clavata]|uniref:Uncharacterized protein n=1 Tax=Trichonephila clavata TaxID=2740835 RepID=A0A8X6GGR3_TRICU|nr:hypothetical protein TNCT_639581 [Trichonephila clavata]